MEDLQPKRENYSVSAIVPVYNEKLTVGSLITSLLNSKLFKEVILVNDGSSDGSKDIISKFGDRIIFIELPENRGKGYAMAEGLSKASSDLILFIDADLTNLTNDHLNNLIEPVKSKKADVTVGMISETYRYQKLLSHISGQRVYQRNDLMPFVEDMRNKKYGIENYLNEKFKTKVTKKVLMKGVGHLNKDMKYNTFVAFNDYLNEAKDIAIELSHKEILIPEDLKIIERLNKATNLNELENQIKSIANKNIKDFLKKYLEKYFKLKVK